MKRNFIGIGIGHRLSGSQSPYGPEILTNGDFTLGNTGWGVANADATHIVTFADGKVRFQSDTTTPVLNFSQTVTLTAGKTYIVEVFVSNYVSGSMKSDQVGNIVVANKSGLNSATGVAGGSAFIGFTRNTPNVDITIDWISVREVL